MKIAETRRIVLSRYGGRCKLCGKWATQAAHILPQDKVHLRRYGAEIIHHPANMEPACGLAHNAAVQINCRSHPRDADEQARRVREIIREENER